MRHEICLEGEQVRLRSFQQQDLEPYRKWVNEPGIMKLVNRFGVVTPEEHQIWFESMLESSQTLVFAVEERVSGHYVGNVWLFNIDRRHRRAEVRILLGEAQAQNRGLGTEAIRLVAQHAFAGLGLEKLFAEVLVTNPRARRAFERAHFSVEAILRGDRISEGERVDVWRMARWCHGQENVDRR